MAEVKKKIKDCFWKQCLVCVGLMMLLFGFYYVTAKHIKLQLREDDFSFVFQIDKVLNEKDEFILDGWAFFLEEETSEGAVELWLYDLEEEKIVYPKKTEFTKRLDVNTYFLCEYDYTDCGIVASFNKEKLDLSNKDFEVLVSDTVNEKVYQTGTYVSNGELMYCLPKEFSELEVIDTDIEKIVNEGILRVYRPDFGMYVYQYKGDLYWIAEPGYGFVDENTFVQFQMNTTQTEKLPEDRIANDWLWSNISFWFKLKELTECNTGKYRVAKGKLPSDYSITEIWTGNHIDEWIWIQHFRPWYGFSE